MTELVIRATAPEAVTRYRGPYPTDRVCPEPHCPTRLCSWNPGPQCYVHTRAEERRRRELEDAATERDRERALLRAERATNTRRTR